MDTIGMELKTNFFESQVSNYQKAGVKTKDHHVFTLDADFWDCSFSKKERHYTQSYINESRIFK